MNSPKRAARFLSLRDSMVFWWISVVTASPVVVGPWGMLGIGLIISDTYKKNFHLNIVLSTDYLPKYLETYPF